MEVRTPEGSGLGRVGLPVAPPSSSPLVGCRGFPEERFHPQNSAGTFRPPLTSRPEPSDVGLACCCRSHDLHLRALPAAKLRSYAAPLTLSCCFSGGNSGIGKATALHLARRGASVILACRNRSKAQAAIADILQVEASGERTATGELTTSCVLTGDRKWRGVLHAAGPGQPGVHPRLLRELPEDGFQTGPARQQRWYRHRSDWLTAERAPGCARERLCPAGLVADGRTDDGFGVQFGVNHLGHFLLTSLLLERLKEAGGGRVVTVSSLAHRWGHIDFQVRRAEGRSPRRGLVLVVLLVMLGLLVQPPRMFTSTVSSVLCVLCIKII